MTSMKKASSTRATNEQSLILRLAYASSPTGLAQDLPGLSAQTGLPEKWIMAWFGRQRAKDRRKSGEAPLARGEIAKVKAEYQDDVAMGVVEEPAPKPQSGKKKKKKKKAKLEQGREQEQEKEQQPPKDTREEKPKRVRIRKKPAATRAPAPAVKTEDARASAGRGVAHDFLRFQAHPQAPERIYACPPGESGAFASDGGYSVFAPQGSVRSDYVGARSGVLLPNMNFIGYSGARGKFQPPLDTASMRECIPSSVLSAVYSAGSGSVFVPGPAAHAYAHGSGSGSGSAHYATSGAPIPRRPLANNMPYHQYAHAHDTLADPSCAPVQCRPANSHPVAEEAVEDPYLLMYPPTPPPLDLDPTRAPLKHLNLLPGADAGLGMDGPLVGKLLSDEMVREDPFTATMGLVYLKHAGLVWD